MQDDLFYQEPTGLICGVDEVGRGPLAGPVITAAVILDPNNPIEGLNDSKKLSAKKREALTPLIKEKALAWAIGEASVEEIDQLNILQATLLAMKRAVDQLSVKPDFVYVDGNKLPHWDYPSEPVIGGDAKVPEISAASIIAKTHRDHLMAEMAKIYPGYGFEKHAGYGTKMHLDALKELGPSPIHRMSFKPVSEAIK